MPIPLVIAVIVAVLLGGAAGLAGLAVVVNWDRIVIAWKGKRLAILNQSTGDWYTHAAIFACCSAAIFSTAAVTAGS